MLPSEEERKGGEGVRVTKNESGRSSKVFTHVIYCGDNAIFATRAPPLGDTIFSSAGLLSAIETSAIWNALPPAFSSATQGTKNDVAWAVIELRGCGRSGGGARFAQYGEEAADMIAAAAGLESDLVGARIVALAGHSKGAAVATLAAGAIVERQERCGIPTTRSLICISGRFDFASGAGVVERFGERDVQRNDEEAFSWEPPFVRRKRPDMAEPEPVVIIRGELTERAALDLGPPLRKFLALDSSRVLLVHGTADDIVPFCDLDAAHRAAPAAQVRAIEGAGHFWRDSSAEIAPLAHAIAEFLS